MNTLIEASSLSAKLATEGRPLGSPSGAWVSYQTLETIHVAYSFGRRPPLADPCRVEHVPAEPVTVLAPPNLHAWCRPPHDEEVWLRPNIRGSLSRSIGSQIYAFGCGGCAKLYDLLGAPIHKIGTTATVSPDARLADLSYQHYGSLFRSQDGWQKAKGFDKWMIVPPKLDRLPCTASAVVVMPSSLGIRLPEGMSAATFDQALNDRLRTVAIDHWVRQPNHWQALMEQGIDPNLALRATPGRGTKSHMAKEASELFFFRKKHEFAALVAIAEDIVLSALWAA